MPSSFRRNQTLSGVRRHTEDPEDSARRRAHHLALTRRRLGAIFLVVLSVVLLLVLLLLQFTARISLVNGSTALVTNYDQAPYVESINDYYARNPAERLRFLLDEAALTAAVSSQHAEVQQVNVAGSTGMIQTDLKMVFRQPVAGWKINDTQYYVDAQGVVFEKNYFAAPEIQIVDESGVTPEQGTAVASGRLLGFVGKMVAVSKGRGYAPVQVSLPEGTTRRLDVRFVDVGPAIRFSVDRGVGEQVEDMARTLTFLASTGASPQFIDVRSAGRIIYQ